MITLILVFTFIFVFFLLVFLFDVDVNILSNNTKQQSIEEAAECYYKTLLRPLADEKGLVETAFVSGATSQAAKEYWYEQFKQEFIYEQHKTKDSLAEGD